MTLGDVVAYLSLAGIVLATTAAIVSSYRGIGGRTFISFLVLALSLVGFGLVQYDGRGAFAMLYIIGPAFISSIGIICVSLALAGRFLRRQSQ